MQETGHRPAPCSGVRHGSKPPPVTAAAIGQKRTFVNTPEPGRLARSPHPGPLVDRLRRPSTSAPLRAPWTIASIG